MGSRADSTMGGASSGASSRALPPDVVASLRAAFAEEVAARLPRVRTLLVDPPLASDPEVLRDAHTLASSAAVVGAAAASRAARELEVLLVAGDRPAAVPRAAAELVAELDAWQP